MPGRIRRRGSKYALVVYAGREGGKRRDRWLTFKSHAEAEAAQRELSSHVLAHSAGVGLYGSPRERLGPYLKDWLGRQKPRLASNTHDWYEIVVEQISRDPLGAIQLGRLTPRALEAYYARRAATGVSGTTVLHHHRLLHKALADAARQDLILKNPADTAVSPKRARPRLEVWTEAQTLLFLSEARASSRYYPVYLFLIGTGARLGEALGLTWRDVALGDGIAYIAQALHRPSGGGYVLKEPKSGHSRRPITLSAEVVEMLRNLQKHQKDEQARRGPCADGARCTRWRCPQWHNIGLVFTLANGCPIHDNNMRLKDLKPLCTKLGLPYHRALHNLRHGHGSYLLQRGVSLKVVQERLGHSTAAFTLSTYTHVLAGMQDQAAEATSAMLSGKARGKEAGK